MKEERLPATNENGYYEIRLESIGGLGANLCGKLIGELALRYMGKNSAGFSSYGSEKSGTPVKAYIRLCDWEQEIRTHSPVVHPHLLVVFHEALLAKENTLEGIMRDTVVLVNSEHTPDKLKEKYALCAQTVYCIPAQQIAMECKARINMILFGGICCLLGLKDCEKPDAVCRDALGRKYASALEKNLEGIHRGFYEVKTQMKSSPQSENEQFYKYSTSEIGNDTEKQHKNDDYATTQEAVNNAATGYENKNNDHTTQQIIANDTEEKVKTTGDAGKYKAPDTLHKHSTLSPEDIKGTGIATRGLTGGAIPWLGNSVINDLSPSRQGYIPLFFPERCIQCAQCDATCPDMVFQFRPGTYKGREMMINMGLDYYHCKGCMRCVTICPVNALVAAKESEYPQKPYFVPNQELVRKPAYYEACGVDGYITSESFLTEKRVDGGEL